MAKEDHFGRDIPLATGNVASRILPIKIHDLDADDKALFQSELGTVLRSVEFIYKSSGVNRPLKADDARIENANRTSYRDQINKVANAIKELMGGLKSLGSSAGARVNHGDVLPGHPLNIKEDKAHGKIRRLLVSTFRILKAGAETDFLAFSLPEAIAGSLSESKNLSIQMDLAGIFSGMTEKELEQLAHERKLEAAISGTVFQVGEEVRVTINLFQLPERSLLWTKSTQQRVENLFQLQDDMVQKILDSLKITLHPSEESAIEDSISKNPRAYPMFLKANQLAIQVSQWEQARDLYIACLDEDPTFVPALARLARCYRLIGKFAKTTEETSRNLALAESTFQQALRLKPDFDQTHGLVAQLEVDLGKPEEAMKRLLLRIQNGGRGSHLFAGLVPAFRWCGLLNESLLADGIAREIDPSINTSIGHTHFMMGSFEKASLFTVGDIGYIQGVSLAALGRTREAIDSLEQNERRTSRESIVCYLRSLRFALEGNKKESLNNLDGARTPGIDAEALYYLVRTYCYLGEQEKAMEGLQEVVRKGFCPVYTFERDAWIASLKDRNAFRRLLDESRRLSEKSLREYRLVFPKGMETVPTTPNKVPV